MKLVGSFFDVYQNKNSRQRQKITALTNLLLAEEDSSLLPVNGTSSKSRSEAFRHFSHVLFPYWIYWKRFCADPMLCRAWHLTASLAHTPETAAAWRQQHYVSRFRLAFIVKELERLWRNFKIKYTRVSLVRTMKYRTLIVRRLEVMDHSELYHSENT